MRFRKLPLLLIAVSLCLSANGQKKPAARKAPAASGDLRWTLISIKVTGSQRYTNDEILAGSGLQIGKSVNEEDFKKATELLGQTGLFSDAAYSYTYSPEGAKLDIQLNDNNPLVPARFDNFVWMSSEELLDKLRERVPLFKGLLPLGGDLADEVSDALQALTIEQKVQGKADYIRLAKRDGPIEAFLYTITAHNIRVQNVTFTDAGAELPLLQEAAKRLLHNDYSHTVIENEERLGFLPIYLQHGHLKASFEEAQVKIAHDSGEETTVDVTIRVTPGLQYKLTDIGWLGNSAFPAQQLAGLIRLKTGEPANEVELEKDLSMVAKVYGTKGYMAPSITPTPLMDDSSSTVHFDIRVHEGDIYNMGELEIRGLDEKTKSKLVFDWKLAEGQVYDSGYVERFLTESRKDLPADSKWTTDIHEALNDDKTVDVTLRYDAKAP
jgi:outer membrane protein assembly factor BamA